MAEHPSLVLHFLMEKYGGTPSQWESEDLATCVKLLDVNSIIQKVAEREKKKKKGLGKGKTPKKPPRKRK